MKRINNIISLVVFSLFVASPHIAIASEMTRQSTKSGIIFVALAGATALVCGIVIGLVVATKSKK